MKQVHSTVETFKNDLEGLNNLQHFDQLKPEDVYEAAPGLENVYHDRLRDGKVFHDDHNFGERHFG